MNNGSGRRDGKKDERGTENVKRKNAYMILC